MKGIYFFVVDNDVRYLGKTTKSFKERFSSLGYDQISPGNCFKGGQSTNCKLNAQMNKGKSKDTNVEIYLVPVENNNEINNLEKCLLSKFNFELNKQHN